MSMRATQNSNLCFDVNNEEKTPVGFLLFFAKKLAFDGVKLYFNS